MGLNQVAIKLGVDRKSAQSFFNAFYNRFRGVKKWMEETKRIALQNKFVLTISGRKRCVYM
jgi:DNA polymerase I-like protein with 3'-5' exonuclease and polymerase domains